MAIFGVEKECMLMWWLTWDNRFIGNTDKSLTKTKTDLHTLPEMLDRHPLTYSHMLTD